VNLKVRSGSPAPGQAVVTEAQNDRAAVTQRDELTVRRPDGPLGLRFAAVGRSLTITGLQETTASAKGVPTDVPVSGTVWGLPGASSTTVTAAARGPAVVGRR
jgi:hypothetical protein